jgi:ABC-type sugar transport system permease subunit
MASIKQQFEIPSGQKTWANVLIGIGAVALLYGMFTKGFSSDEHEQVHFWGTLMYNTIYWTLITNAAMFFLCFSAMAQAAWMQSFRRIAEAISTLVPVFGTITIVVLLYIVLGGKHHIYHWLDTEAVAKDPILKGKVGFLNPTFYIIWSLLAVGLWSYFGYRMRQLSNEADQGPMDNETAKAFNIKSMWRAGFFLVMVNEY